MKVREILRSKGDQVFTIETDATLNVVAEKLVAHNCGSLVVSRQDGSMAGIITERDILRACAQHSGRLDGLLAADYMSQDVHKGHPDEDINDLLGLMTKNRVRHLPIEEDGRRVGLISIGDLVKAQHNQLNVENHYLKNYIQS